MTIKREQILTLSILGAILLLVVGYTWKTVNDARRQDAANNPATKALGTEEGVAPYTDLSGDVIALDAYVGNVLIANSWASWSPESATELSRLAAIADEFSTEGVVVLAINRAEPKTTAERFLHVAGVPDEVKLILDPDDHYYRSIAGYAMPETLIYNHKGEVVYHHRGSIPAVVLRENIAKALAQTE